MSDLESQLSVNEAGLLVSGDTNSTAVYLWGQAVECYKCDLLKIATVFVGNESFSKFPTQFRWNLALLSENNSKICEENDVTFGEHGVYRWNYSNRTCSPLSVVVSPIDPLIPIIVMETAFILWMLSWRICKWVCRRSSVFQRTLRSLSAVSEVENDLGSLDEANELITPASPEARSTERRRIRSLDVFRGFAIASMIFVNYGGGEYWFMKHSPWNGFTYADLIFPWFAWIMGVSLAVKVKSELRSSVRRTTLICKLAYRSCVLILLGVLVTNIGQDDLSTLRLPGVFQRLGISYFVVGVLEAMFMTPQPNLQNSRFKWIEEVVESWRQWTFVIVLVVVHTCVTFLLPVPGCPTGYLGAGGLSEHSAYFNCTGGAAGYIDRLLLTENHIYSTPTCQKLYKCDKPYDPEGILGVLTTILCVYLGVHAGRILHIYRPSRQRCTRWLVCSVIMISMGGLLSDFSINDGPIPINKNLWSLSYVLVTSGLAFFLFCVFYILVDKKKWWSGYPFYQTGMNSLVLYFGHEIFARTFPWQWKPFFPTTHTEYFVMDLWATFLWICVAVIMYKRKLFAVL